MYQYQHQQPPYPPAGSSSSQPYPPGPAYGGPSTAPAPPYGQPYQQQPPYYGASNGAAAASSSANGYGSPAYPPQPPRNFQQPPYPVPQQPPQPPRPQIPYNVGTDPNVFRNYFSHELRQLTFNSKPIINHLTMFAHEHAQRMAPVVAQCLEDHIRQAAPSVKLPALYLLDSICKNLGPPYTVLFAPTIDRIFLSAYHEVDSSTKVKLEELLGTWRNGGRDGGELFPLPPYAPPSQLPAQRIIEDQLFGRPQPPPPMPPSAAVLSPPLPSAFPPPPASLQQLARHSPPPVPQPQPGTANNAERAAVLFELRKLLDIRRQQAAVNWNDRSIHDQIATLEQLEQLVNKTTLGSAQIAAIREQVARLTPSQMPTPPIPPRVEVYSEPSRKKIRLISPPPPSRTFSPSGLAPNAALASLTSLLNPDLIRTASAQGVHQTGTPPVVHQAPPLVAPAPVSPQPSQHMAALGNYETPAQASTSGPDPAVVAAAQAKAANESATAAYEQHRLHYFVRLQNSDIARYRPGSQALLYEAMPLRCKQCGNRYLDCPLGKERLDKDLDRHLRVSRRYNEGVGAQRQINRSWFVSEDEWVLPAHAVPPSEAVIKSEEAKKKAAATAELLGKTVPVPADAANNVEKRTCPICKEEFKNEYSEEDEDWVWRNAVEVDGKIYHASCWAEQQE